MLCSVLHYPAFTKVHNFVVQVRNTYASCCYFSIKNEFWTSTEIVARANSPAIALPSTSPIPAYSGSRSIITATHGASNFFPYFFSASFSFALLFTNFCGWCILSCRLPPTFSCKSVRRLWETLLDYSNINDSTYNFVEEELMRVLWWERTLRMQFPWHEKGFCTFSEVGIRFLIVM